MNKEKNTDSKNMIITRSLENSMDVNAPEKTGIGLDAKDAPEKGKSEYERFEKMLLSHAKGDIYWMKDPLNAKQSYESNMFLDMENAGLVPYEDFGTVIETVLDECEIESQSFRDKYKKRFAKSRKIRELNKNSDYLVATPNGDVIDLKALSTISHKGIDPEQHRNKWIVPISQYKENFITLRTGVNYPEKADIKQGETALEEFLKLVLYYPDTETLQDTMVWLKQYMGRLLIGNNTWKEFVTFLGEADSGKTTFTNFLADIMDSYCGSMTDDMLFSTDSSQIRRELHKRKDNRLLTHSEGSAFRKINTVTLKRITGDSRIPLNDDIGAIDFTMHGKIIADTNYAPFPDNIEDEAFNNRLIIIPFRKNTEASMDEIDRAVRNLKDSMQNIFALMVHSSVLSIDNANKTQPKCSDRAKYEIYVIRNTAKVFYDTACDKTVPMDVCITGKELYENYCNWWNATVKAPIKAISYLRSEIENRSRNQMLEYSDFHKAIRQLHVYNETHTNVGIKYRGLRVNKYAINGVKPSFQYDMVAETMKTMAKNIDNLASDMDIASEPIKYREDMENALNRGRKKIVDKIVQNPHSATLTSQYLGNNYMNYPQNGGLPDGGMPGLPFTQATDLAQYNLQMQNLYFLSEMARLENIRKAMSSINNPPKPPQLDTLPVMTDEQHNRVVKEAHSTGKYQATPYDDELDIVKPELWITPYDVVERKKSDD
ncbi:MAG: hypothetical protein LBQ74_15215 [Prevotella sp.]|jgi:phage/plasmid-associated DNA primase|nr:hypothetical protein [Prevotella sp.]